MKDLLDNGVLNKSPEIDKINELEKLFNDLKDLPDEDLPLYNESKDYLNSLKKVVLCMFGVRQ